MNSWLGRHWWWIAIAIAYLYLFPHFPQIRSANELPRVYLVKAMADEGRFAIDTGVKRWGSTADVSPARGHQYSNKAPGSSMLVVPVYWAIAKVAGEPSLGFSVWLCRVVAGVIPALMFLVLLARFLARYAPDPDVRRLVLVAYALGSMAMTYSVLFIAHQLAAICAAAAWIYALDAIDRQRGMRAFVAAGLLAGAAPLVDYQAAFALVPLAIHVLWKLRTWPRRRLLRAIGLLAVAAALPIAVLLAYHAACFGSPLRTGYDASETFAVYHQQGFLGITKLRSEAFWGTTVLPHFGLFPLMPWLVLAFPGFVALWRTQRRDIAIVSALILVIYILFISSINFWRGGWSVGPRYITVLLPFLLPPIAAQLERWRHLRAAMIASSALIVAAIVIFVITTATFPYWPESFANPFFELNLRLVGDHLVAPNLGTWIGLPPLLSIVPVLVATCVLVGAPLRRLVGWLGVALTVVGATALLVAYLAFPATKNPDGPYKRVVPAIRAAQP